MNNQMDNAGVNLMTISGAEVHKNATVIEQALSLQREWIADRVQTSNRAGFLISLFDADELINLVKQGSLHYATKDQKLVGYILTTPIEEFTKLLTSAENSYTKPKWMNISPSLEYLYQIAVSRNLGRTGLGSTLLKYALSKVRHSILTDVLIEPVANKASLRFFKKNGFRDAGILTLKDYRNFGNLKSQVLLWNP